MDIKITITLLTLASGIISGILVSIFGPLMKWNIEKRRLKLEYRRNLIAQWRSKIDSDFKASDFRETVEFSQMQRYLSEDMEKVLNPLDFRNGVPVVNFRSVIGRDNLKDRLLEEIALIEKKWNLI